MDSKRGPFQPGQRFQKWEIRGLIGRGGHAYVYEAHDPFLSLDVAIKIIPSSRDTGRDLVARARSEARVLVRISHPNVVKIMDAGATEEGLVYLVMEKLAGRDLRRVLRQYGRLTPIEALRVAVQAAEAVAAAHAAGAIHRDLKPENVFICRDQVIKVLDFGIAKVMGYGAPTTQKDLLHGTVLYMPPEQLKGLGVTARSDIFSLGTLLYEALHHHPALLGKEVPTVQELGWIQIERMPPLLNKVDRAIPAHVARFVQRALMKNPEQRYASMAEMADAARSTLARLLAETGSKADPSTDRDLSIAPQTEEAPPSSRKDVSGPKPVDPTQDTELLSNSYPPPPLPEPHRAASQGSEPQLTPPPTISLISEKPMGLAERLGSELPWRPIAVWGSVAGLGLGVAYASLALKPNHPNPPTASASLPTTAGRETSEAASKPLPAPASAARLGEEPPSGAAIGAEAQKPSPGPTERSATAAYPSTPVVGGPAPASARPGPSTSGRPVATVNPGPKPAAPAKPRSAMDERLDWLERDLKSKPASSSAPAKHPQSELPSSGL